jgi:hypothetical protein
VEHESEVFCAELEYSGEKKGMRQITVMEFRWKQRNEKKLEIEKERLQRLLMLTVL